ncbi:VIT1/CCC1 family predicted Fe2+/Mn2+ transporter [Corticibacter populi]|nr:VIT1/CCC1 family predicted Fe2+/Mn2+ transporter [Corticibacter populi]
MNPASISNRLNWLRAGVLGANDGIVSTAGLVLGVAGASTSQSALLVAGVAGLVSGALSMAAGEYVSVSTQRDTEKAAIAQEKDELAALPQAELAELATLLEQKGLSHGVAQQAACELTRHNALAAHAEMELGIKPGHYTNPWQAAAASALSFSIGALVPLLAVALAPAGPRLPIAVLAVAMALSVTGLASAKLGNAAMLPALVRNVGGGLLAMGVTFYVGRLVAPLLAA